MLGEYVERVARYRDGLNLASLHPFSNEGRLHEIAAELREHHSLADPSDVMAGPTDALHAAGNTWR